MTESRDYCENTSIDDGIVVDQTDEDSENEVGNDPSALQATPAMELDSCSDIHVGPRLHYHCPVVINQNFLNPREDLPASEDLKQEAATLPIKQFNIINDKGENITEEDHKTNQSNNIPSVLWFSKRSHLLAVIVGVFLTNVVITLTLVKFAVERTKNDNLSCERDLQNTKAIVKLLKGRCTDNSTKECFNLFAAVKSADKDFVQFLLNASDIHAFDKKGWTPLHYASYNGKTDIVKIMAKYGANLSIETNNRIGDPPIHHSAGKGHITLTEWFLDQGISVMIRNKLGSTILHAASSKGHLELCKKLIKRGSDVNARMTYLHMWTPLHKAVLYNYLNVVQLLVDKGAELDAVTNDDHETSLHYAARNGTYDIVKFLISRGANYTIEDKNGDTPLEAALSKNRTRVVELLTSYAEKNVLITETTSNSSLVEEHDNT
ncbi:putative ankyrin repeat protein RF_0381 [Periplaneta americana]|uniref:putative ankyrin repeat protein RF_0381 n=1 Tax=Periplaneta americana TaxID=6978 RepID=UPI0037E84C0B